MLHCVPAGLFIKDKVGHLLPSRIYTEPLPHSHTFASLMYNTRDHNNVHDLVQPFNIDTDSHVVDSGPEFSSYPRHKRRLEEEAYVSDMVAVAAGSRPYSMKTEEPATLQQLVKESQPSPGFWDSFIKLK